MALKNSLMPNNAVLLQTILLIIIKSTYFRRLRRDAFLICTTRGFLGKHYFTSNVG